LFFFRRVSTSMTRWISFPADCRIELTLRRELREVAAEVIERRRLGFLSPFGAACAGWLLVGC
jgi:hypothetical protein